MKFQPIVVLAFILICLAAPARADWVRAETENFIFLGEVEEKKALELLHELEVFRSSILALTSTEYFPEVRKVRVFGFRKSSGVRDLAGRSRVLGIYAQGNDFPIIATVVGGRGDRGRSVILHEYAHHVLNSLAADYYPRWYNEGLAEYLASFGVDNEIVTIGKPASSFGTLLDTPKWTDIETVLTSVTNYPFDASSSSVDAYRNSLFYGVCWIAVHYLQNTPRVNSGFSDYIALLNSGTDPLVAFEQGFGISPEEFEERLHDYWRADRFPVVQFRMTESFAFSNAQVTQVADDEAEISLVMARAMFAGRGPEEEKARARIRRDLGKLLQEHDDAIHLYYALMILELRESDYDAAVAAGEDALTVAPDDPLAVQTLADALYHRYSDDGMQNKSDLSRSRQLFRSQLEIDPGNPTANAHYPRTILLDQSEPDKLSVDAVVFNLRRRTSPIYITTYLDSAELLARAGSKETACLLLDKIDNWVRVLDSEMTEEERSNIRRQGHETRLERHARIEAELGEYCHTD